MERKKLGILLVILSVLFGFFLIYFSSNYSDKSETMNCNPSEECKSISNALSITHIGFGFFGFMLALGFYILFFNKTEEKIMKRLEDDKNKSIERERFEIILKALDDYEKKVMTVVREQEGITQNTLKLRANLSKAKLSYVLQELEKRNLIKRIPKGKTLEVHLTI